MKKILLSLVVAFALMFTACNPQNNGFNAIEQDTIIVVSDSIPSDSLKVNMNDTLHCVAITKTGTRCKNHRVAGDTLCAVHKKMR